MEQEINIQQQLAELLAAPEKVSQENAAMLKDLAELYPYFQPVHLLLAKATILSEQNSNLATAALYNGGQVLHNLLHAPERLLNTEFKVIHLSQPAPIADESAHIDKAAIPEVISVERLADEQEVYEEIGEVDIREYQQVNPASEPIATSDFFAFQDNFQVEPVPEVSEQDEPPIEEYTEKEDSVKEESPEDEESIVISKYDDDKLPYTFLWWLAKTRKEHQQIFQPYASPKQGKTAQKAITEQKNPGDLQQQYVEHIFHIQSPFNEEETVDSATHFKLNTKGSEIIESFIRNEPQISPPKPEQINNENKARKSAEDHNDLVSETLAKIYIEQMLYDKAIETYEKLSLKFPEKSRYFADLIQSIEKKI